MPKPANTVAIDWRESDARAIEERVMAMVNWIGHTEDLVEMLGDDEAAAKELRVAAGIIKMRRNDLAQKVKELRAALADRNGSTD